MTTPTNPDNTVQLAPGITQSGSFVFLTGDARILTICPRGFANELTVFPILPQYTEAAQSVAESFHANTEGWANIKTLQEIAGTTAGSKAASWSGEKLKVIENSLVKALGL